MNLTLPSPAAQCAVGCVRVSTDQQQDRYGPERQRRDIEREATYAGLTLVHWHEEAISGAKIERYNENAYYDLARQHPGITFIFSASNRVGRHVEIIVGIARNLLKMRAGVYVAGIGDLSRPRNWKEFLRDSVDAESDYTNIIKQLTDGKVEKAQAGHWAQGRVPWGYRLVRDERGISTVPELHPDHAPVVRRVGEIYAQHGGETATARQLNSEGLKTATGKPWTTAAVASIVRNTRYAGRAEFYGHVITYPAIFEPDLWAAMQAQRKNRKKGERPIVTKNYLLSGHARCGECGGSMGVNRSMGGGRGHGRYVYYRCWRAGAPKEAGKRSCTHGTYYPVARLEDTAWQAIIDVLIRPEQVQALLSLGVPPEPAAPRLAAIQREMTDLLTRAARYDLPDEVVRAALEPLQAEKTRLEAAQEAVMPLIPSDVLEACQALAERLPGLPRDDRDSVLRDLRVKLEVQPGGIVTVTELNLPQA